MSIIRLSLLKICCREVLMNRPKENKWKAEQLKIFKEYIKSFAPDSPEYNRIHRAILTLENKI